MLAQEPVGLAREQVQGQVAWGPGLVQVREAWVRVQEPALAGLARGRALVQVASGQVPVPVPARGALGLVRVPAKVRAVWGQEPGPVETAEVVAGVGEIRWTAGPARGPVRAPGQGVVRAVSARPEGCQCTARSRVQ